MKKLFLLITMTFLPLLAHAFTGEVEIDGINYFIKTAGNAAEVSYDRNLVPVSSNKLAKKTRKKHAVARGGNMPIFDQKVGMFWHESRHVLCVVGGVDSEFRNSVLWGT